MEHTGETFSVSPCVSSVSPFVRLPRSAQRCHRDSEDRNHHSAVVDVKINIITEDVRGVMLEQTFRRGVLLRSRKARGVISRATR